MQAAPALHSPASSLLRQLWRWVLAEPKPQPLVGQHCDRLRPRFVARALELELAHQVGPGTTLLTWQWNSRTGQVNGLLLGANQLLRFHWIPGLRPFNAQPVAELRPRLWPLRLVNAWRPSGHD